MPCYRPSVVCLDYSKNPPKVLEYHNGLKTGGINYEYFEEMNRLYKSSGRRIEYIKVKCQGKNKCIGCKEAESKDWATRCVLESNLWEHNYFLTITYNDDYLPREDELLNKKTGEIFQNDNWEQGHLVKEELKEFMDDLRAYWKYHYNHDNIRFFCCGEYGSAPDGTHRPHYHILLFNFPIPTNELQIRKIDPDGSIHWRHEGIEKCWKDKRLSTRTNIVSKGFIDICEVNWDTCAYVARYTVKKYGEGKDDDYYYSQGKTPEFINMSRKPGIGMEFFTKNFKDIYRNDEIIIKGHREKIQPVKPPTYFDKKYDIIDHQGFLRIKNERKRIADYLTRTSNIQSSLTEYERLKEAEKIKKQKMNTLKRDKAFI